ncbi:ABC transporter substrate-binding protein [Stutzerimonas chloritidismutans]|uniref:ABC transporter substrate-binding protein n=1 Tax=Stutzerimonas chloritidismutans TaxID=203192 RepID=UPI00384D9A9F
MYFRNKHRLALLAAAIATWLSVTAGPVSANDKVFDVVAPFEIGGLDPAISGFVFQRMQITETLLESDAKGQPLPALAERWSVSDDGKEWRLTIRQGVKFHDGSALTAEVAAHSLSAANTRTGMLRSAKIDAITADDNDVVIRLVEPFKPLTAVLAHSSTNILATAAYDADDNVQSVIGTGPYRLTLLEPPQRLAAERFEDYWGEKPSIKKRPTLAQDAVRPVRSWPKVTAPSSSFRSTRPASPGSNAPNT